jgi:nucleolar protein 15
MGRTKETEKSGSKEKGIISERTKASKGAKAKDFPSAKFPEASIPRVSSKKDLKKPTTSTLKTTGSARIDGSKGTSLSSAQAANKSTTKTDGDSISKASKSRDIVPHASTSSSKKRAREEPGMDSNETAAVTKKKKLDQTSENAVEKRSTRQKKVAKPPSAASDDSEEDSSAEGQVEKEDDEVYLHGFSTDEDSSDEDEEAMDQDPLEVNSLPSKAKDDAEVKRRLDAAKRKPVRQL